ncbi:hypothetical protein [Micromonospora sp. ATA51]|uniref:hypothetical protein n=1 Tax=Micromonospora sp. ATA51 TaxID=2806098 RepID=UPI0035CC23DF
MPTPKLDWYACYGYAECATVRLPLDYDQPKGATTEVAVLRVKARDQQHRIGSLFLNPGGPGGSGTDIALAAPYFLADDLLDRFDVVASTRAASPPARTSNASGRSRTRPGRTPG